MVLSVADVQSIIDNSGAGADEKEDLKRQINDLKTLAESKQLELEKMTKAVI